MKKSRKIGYSLLYIVIIAIAAYVLHLLFYTRTGLHITHTNINDLSVYLRSLGPLALIIGITAILVQTFIPFSPFMLLAGANVLAFGFFDGFIINYLAACAGAFLAFMFARYYGHDWVERKLARYPLMAQFNQKMKKEGFFYVLIGRFIPIFPSSIINFGGGVSKISVKHFLFATLLGKLPVVFLESLIAHDLQHLHRYRDRLLLLLAIFILLILIGNWIRQKSIRRTGK